MLTATEIRQNILNWAKENWSEWDEKTPEDPLISLMIGACSNELAHIYKQIDNTTQKVTEKLTSSLIPTWRNGPKPSQSLAYVYPKGSLSQINARSLRFKTSSKKGILGQSIEEVFWSSLGEVNLIKANIPIFAIHTENKNVFEIRIDDYIEIYAKKTDPHRKIEDKTQTLVLFVNLDGDNIKSLENISLFFDLPVSSNLEDDKKIISDQKFLNEMLRANWSLNGKRITIKPGLPEPSLTINDAFNPMRILEKDIRNNFKHHFITFAEDSVITPSHHIEFPRNLGIEKLRETYHNDISPNPTIIKIEFERPVAISEDLFVSFNCFPILNRNLVNKEEWYRYTGILPIQLSENHGKFLGLESVNEQNDQNTPFVYTPLTSFNKGIVQNKYTYIKRGIGRFDDYNYWDRYSFVILHFLEVYRQAGTKKTPAELIELLEQFSLEELQHLMESRPEPKSLLDGTDSYVLLQKSDSAPIRIQVSYWETLGDLANVVSAGSEISLIEGIPELEEGSFLFLRPAKGGKGIPSTQEGLRALKDVLFQSERIVSHGDIAKACRAKLGNAILQIRVSNGTAINPLERKGIYRVIDVDIQLSNKNGEYEIKDLEQSLEQDLNQRSRGITPIMVHLIN